jgi:hypothetical protein
MTTDRSPEDVLGQLTADLGGSLGTVLTGLGIRCGLWEALAGAGPLSAAEVARRAGIVEPYAREWLRAQAAGGYLDYHPATDRFTLPEPVAVALLQAPGGALVDACLSMFASMGAGFAEFEQAFRAGRGYGWDRRDATYWQGTDGLTRAMLPPAVLAGAVERLPGTPTGCWPAAGSPTSAAGTGRRRSCSPRRSLRRRSPGSTTTTRRWRPPARRRPRPGSGPGSASRSRPPPSCRVAGTT